MHLAVSTISKLASFSHLLLYKSPLSCNLTHLLRFVTPQRGRHTRMDPPFLLAYTSRADWPRRSGDDASSPIRIAVLDSCFNPPSLAHYAMAIHDAPVERAYIARLLLLSSKNVDKVHKEGDTSFDERIEMMKIEAKRMGTERRQGCDNVAVASLAAATFAEKAPIILQHLRTSSPNGLFQLCFYIGFDTVTRLFAKRYYSDSDEEMREVLHKFFVTDDCEVICARRPVESVAQQDIAGQDEAELVQRPLVKEYLDQGKLHMVDIEGTAGISSTQIRNSLSARGSEDVRSKLNALASKDVIDFCIGRQLYKDI